MNYWWRLYAHLAPLLPGTDLLSRVEYNARTAQPVPEFIELKADKAYASELMLQILAEEDEQKLKDLSHTLHEEIALLADQEYGERLAAFRDLRITLFHKGHNLTGFSHKFRFYPGQISAPRGQ